MSAPLTAPRATAWLDRVPPYVPGTAAPRGGLALASNEAVGFSPAVSRALSDGAAWNRYPDPLATPLRAALAAKHGVDIDQILVGNGSDELVQLLVAAFVGKDGTVVAADPPYAMSRICTLIVGGHFIGVPLVEAHHDLDAIAAVPAELAYVVNPHNPTGTLRTRAEIAAFAAQARANVRVIDEAYIDFADADDVDAVPLIADGRTVVLRTFSKAYGLAGLRVGYLIASAEIVAQLRRVRAPFSVTAPAQLAALAALGDAEYLRRHVADVQQVRRSLTRELRACGAEVPDSHANFVLATGIDETAAISALAAEGIAVRAGTGLGLPGSIRITVPQPNDLPRLLDAVTRAVDGSITNPSR